MFRSPRRHTRNFADSRNFRRALLTRSVEKEERKKKLARRAGGCAGAPERRERERERERRKEEKSARAWIFSTVIAFFLLSFVLFFFPSPPSAFNGLPEGARRGALLLGSELINLTTRAPDRFLLLRFPLHVEAQYFSDHADGWCAISSDGIAAEMAPLSLRNTYESRDAVFTVLSLNFL